MIVVVTQNATIAASGTTSTVVDGRELELIAVELPAGFTTSDVSFTSCATDSGTFKTFRQSGTTAVKITSAAANEKVGLFGDAMPALEYFKLVCATPQVSAVTVRLLFKTLA